MGRALQEAGSDWGRTGEIQEGPSVKGPAGGSAGGVGGKSLSLKGGFRPRESEA